MSYLYTKHIYYKLNTIRRFVVLSYIFTHTLTRSNQENKNTKVT